MQLHTGDCLSVLRTLPDNSVDSIVTDPPYGLSFMGKKWDYDVPSVDIWKECLRVLKPGGHLLSFAGTRTQHRMAVNIEDAGFEIRDMIGWMYGTGFPKSHDISKAIDKAAGAEREILGVGAAACEYIERGEACKGHGDAGKSQSGPTIHAPRTAPSTEAAKQWAGWGSALKPSFEPVTMARKPLSGTLAANVLEHGTGGLNIDGCRVETSDKYAYPNGPGGKSHHYSSDARSKDVRPNPTQMHDAGRWPANLIHDGSEEVLELFPVTTSGKAAAGGHKRKESLGYESAVNYADRSENAGTLYGDSGSAARFFYCAKASRKDRDEGLEGLPTVTADPYGQHRGRRMDGNDTRIDGKPPKTGKNNHPTVKPTDLMRYLCRLVTPPGGIVLDPFMGSGSTGKAAVLEGFDFIGVDLDPEYVKIAEARITKAKSLDFSPLL